jgi:hypothetical protein
MSAVETDFCAVKAGADPEFEGLGCVLDVFLVRGVIHGYPAVRARVFDNDSFAVILSDAELLI